MIPARLLQQFIAVAEELHFKRAAMRLHMAQSPLSQAIKHLEDIVGVQLFERSQHLVALTPAGMMFLDRARELLLSGQRAIDAARRVSRGCEGWVTLGFVGSVSYALLPRLLSNWRACFPHLHVELRELSSKEQIESLLAGQINLGIVRLPVSNAAGIALRTIGRECLIAVLPRQHRLARRRHVYLKELADESFVVFPSARIPSMHAKFLLACEEAGFSPRIALEAWQMASMVSLVAAGIGVALLPEQVRNSPHAGVVYKDLADQSEHFVLRIAMAWRPDRLSADVNALLSQLDEEDG